MEDTTAGEFAARGAKVVVTARDQEDVDQAAVNLGEDVTGIAADISDREQMDALYEQIQSRFGRLNHVIANAASGHHSVLQSITDDEFDLTFGVNVKGTFYTVQKALAWLKAGAVSPSSAQPPRSNRRTG